MTDLERQEVMWTRRRCRDGYLDDTGPTEVDTEYTMSRSLSTPYTVYQNYIIITSPLHTISILSPSIQLQ